MPTVQVQTEGGFPLVAPSPEQAEYDDDDSSRMQRHELQTQRGEGVHRLIDEDADEDGGEGDDGHERFDGATSASASAPLHDGAVVGDGGDDVDDGGTIRARHPASEGGEAASRPSSATGDVSSPAAARTLSPTPPRPPPDGDDGWAWQLRQQFDHWRRSRSFEGAVLGLASSSPHGAASIIKVMTVCNLGSLLFFVHTSLWYVEEMRKVQHRGGGGSFGDVVSPDIPSTQDLIDFSSATSGSGTTRRLRVLSAIWRVLLLGPADGYANGGTVSSRGGSLDTRLIWSWLVAQMFVGFVKLLLRLITLYQCDRVLALSPTTSGDVPPSTPLLSSIMVDSGRRTDGTTSGGDLERERRNEDITGLGDRRPRWTEGRRMLREAEARREREREQVGAQRRRLNRMVGGVPFRAHAAAGRAAQILVAFGFVLYLVRGSRRLLLLSSDGRGSGVSAASTILSPHLDAPLSPSPFEGQDILGSNRGDAVVEINVCVSAADLLVHGEYYDQLRYATAPQLPRGGLSCTTLIYAVGDETEYSMATLERQVVEIAGTFFASYCSSANCCYHDVHSGVACWWESEDDSTSPPYQIEFAAPHPWTKVDNSDGGEIATGPTGSAEAAEEAINSAVLLDVCCTNLIVCLFRALMALGVVHFHVVQERRAVHRRRLAMRRERRGLRPDEIRTMECAVFGDDGAREDVLEGDEGSGGGGIDATVGDEEGDWRFNVEENRGMCSICLECYRTGDRLTVLPCDGRHRFHSGCIREWLVKCSTCPLCQGNLRSIMNMSSSSSDYKVR